MDIFHERLRELCIPESTATGVRVWSKLESLTGGDPSLLCEISSEMLDGLSMVPEWVCSECDGKNQTKRYNKRKPALLVPNDP